MEYIAFPSGDNIQMTINDRDFVGITVCQRNKNCNWYFAFAGVGLGPNKNCRWLNYKRLSTAQPHLTVVLASFVTITFLFTVQNIAQLRHLNIIHEVNGKVTTNQLCWHPYKFSWCLLSWRYFAYRIATLGNITIWSVNILLSIQW